MQMQIHHGHERIMVFAVVMHCMQPIVIQDAVVDALRCGAIIIGQHPLLCPAGDGRIKPDVPVRREMGLWVVHYTQRYRRLLRSEAVRCRQILIYHMG